MPIQVDKYVEGYYRHGDHVRFLNENGQYLVILMDGKCKNKEVALSRDYWAINRDGGYLYSNQVPRPA